MPEKILACQSSLCQSNIKPILAKLLPLHEHLKELKSELKDALKVSACRGHFKFSARDHSR
jgi:hypothetical protein